MSVNGEPLVDMSRKQTAQKIQSVKVIMNVICILLGEHVLMINVCVLGPSQGAITITFNRIHPPKVNLMDIGEFRLAKVCVCSIPTERLFVQPSCQETQASCGGEDERFYRRYSWHYTSCTCSWLVDCSVPLNVFPPGHLLMLLLLFPCVAAIINH